MKPTIELLRRHDVDAPDVGAFAFRPGWRVRGRLDQLLADRRITPGEWQAADEYRTAWGQAIRIGSLGAIRWGRSGGSGDPHKRALALLEAIDRLQATELLIGPLATKLAFLCAVEDAPWARTAAAYHRDPETIRDWTAAAIKALAAAWARAGPRRSSTNRQRRRVR